MAEGIKRLVEDAAVQAIFAEPFHIDGHTAQADIIRRSGNGWHLSDAKSHTSDKPELVDDVSYTAIVIERSGTPMPVRRFS